MPIKATEDNYQFRKEKILTLVHLVCACWQSLACVAGGWK